MPSTWYGRLMRCDLKLEKASWPWTENKQEPKFHSCFLFHPYPGSFWGPEAEGWHKSGQSVVPKSHPSCPVVSAGPGPLMTMPSILVLMAFSSFRDDLEIICQWVITSFILLQSVSWRELNSCCWFSVKSWNFQSFSVNGMRRDSL